MGLGQSQSRRVNGFWLNHKRPHDRGDPRTNIAWCGPKIISPQMPMSAHGTREKRFGAAAIQSGM